MTDLQQAERSTEVQQLIALCGSRYAKCTFTSFNAATPEQQAARDKVVCYANDMSDHLADGTNLIIFGPRGTGKDHLMFALMRHAIMRHGLEMRSDWRANRDRPCEMLHWVNGLDVFAEFRDAMDSKEKSERQLQNKYAGPTVMAISDPLPPTGPITIFQADIIFRILDRRYRHKRPTWITCNVADGDELDKRLGLQNADRLRDGAVVVHCNWESFRRARNSDTHGKE